MSNPIAGFKVPENYKSEIDRSKILGPDGKVDDRLLVEAINELGRRQYRQDILRRLLYQF